MGHVCEGELAAEEVVVDRWRMVWISEMERVVADLEKEVTAVGVLLGVDVGALLDRRRSALRGFRGRYCFEVARMVGILSGWLEDYCARHQWRRSGCNEEGFKGIGMCPGCRWQDYCPIRATEFCEALGFVGK